MSDHSGTDNIHSQIAASEARRGSARGRGDGLRKAGQAMEDGWAHTKSVEALERLKAAGGIEQYEASMRQNGADPSAPGADGQS